MRAGDRVHISSLDDGGLAGLVGELVITPNISRVVISSDTLVTFIMVQSVVVQPNLEAVDEGWM